MRKTNLMIGAWVVVWTWCCMGAPVPGARLLWSPSTATAAPNYEERQADALERLAKAQEATAAAQEETAAAIRQVAKAVEQAGRGR
jgi:hypothetical protein